MSLFKEAARLADEYQEASSLQVWNQQQRRLGVADAMADFLRTIAALEGVSVEPEAWRLFDGEGGFEFSDGDPPAESVLWVARYGREYEPLYTQQALDAAVLKAHDAAALPILERLLEKSRDPNTERWEITELIRAEIAALKGKP